MNKHNAIGVRDVESGEVTVCASGDAGANYHTLCGVSLDDDCFEPIDIQDNKRVDCAACKRVWKLARSFMADDFTRN